MVEGNTVMSHYRYFGSGMHMSAVLKQDIARVRAARPGFYTPKKVVETRVDGEGNATTHEILNVRAVAPTPARRHAFSVAKWG